MGRYIVISFSPFHLLNLTKVPPPRIMNTCSRLKKLFILSFQHTKSVVETIFAVKHQNFGSLNWYKGNRQGVNIAVSHSILLFFPNPYRLYRKKSFERILLGFAISLKNVAELFFSTMEPRKLGICESYRCDKWVLSHNLTSTETKYTILNITVY